jgi:4-carboxymuconolactone decarboxylase
MADSDVKKATDELKALAPDYVLLTQDVLFGDVWKRPPLSQRDKSLIAVTCLVALNRTSRIPS